MSLKGFSSLVSNLESFSKDIEVKKPVQTINAILQVASAISVQYAPVEYSVLINSRRQRVDNVGGKIVGVFGYYTDYAAYLNFSPDWSPRPPERKAGPSWNPNATMGFIQKGFESSEARAQIQKVITEVNKI